MRHPKDIDPKDVVGVVKFDLSRADFFKTVGDFILKLKDKAEDKSYFKETINIYVFGTVNGEVLNEMWLVREGGTLTGDGEIKKETKLPEVDPALSEWLKNVPEIRYELASKLEKILRYSTGGTNHKFLIDKFIHDHFIVIEKDQIEDWNNYLQHQEKKREKQKEKLEEKLKITSDPNFVKYAEHIKKEHGYSIDDDFFPQMFFLHKYFEETPEDVLKKDWDEVNKDVGSEGPTVDEYLQSISPEYQYRKGYTSGAEAFKNKVEERLKTYDHSMISISAITDLLKDIYENE